MAYDDIDENGNERPDWFGEHIIPWMVLAMLVMQAVILVVLVAEGVRRLC